MIRRASRKPPDPPQTEAEQKAARELRDKRQERAQRSKGGKPLFALGDAVASGLSVLGITEDAVSKWLGRPCGCKQRREKLNRLSRWVHAKMRGQELPPPEGLT